MNQEVCIRRFRFMEKVENPSYSLFIFLRILCKNFSLIKKSREYLYRCDILAESNIWTQNTSVRALECLSDWDIQLRTVLEMWENAVLHSLYHSMFEFYFQCHPELLWRRVFIYFSLHKRAKTTVWSWSRILTTPNRDHDPEYLVPTVIMGSE